MTHKVYKMHNPVFASSAKRRMRSYRAPLLISLYGIFLLVVSIAAIATLQQNELSLNDLRIGLNTYVYLVVMQFILIILVAPALTAGSISGERERQTLDLLLSTRVGAFRIVIGKMLSTVSFLALMIFTSLPAMAITLFFGGVAFIDMLFSVAFLIICAFSCCAIGIFCSALFKRSVTSTVVAYLFVFAFGIGTLVFPILFQQSALTKAIDISYQVTSYSGTVTASMPTAQDVMSALPKILYLNPMIGLLALLIRQTGLMQETFANLIRDYSYTFSRMYNIIQFSDIVAYVNIGFMLVAGAILTVCSALFIKPAGRRVRKK